MSISRRGWPFRNPPNVRFGPNKSSIQWDKLEGWWPFLAGRGDRIPDLLGRGQHGTLTNGPTWSTGSKRGRGVEFDSNNDAIAIANPDNIDPSYSSLTFSLWLRWDGDDGSSQYIISKRSGWPNVRWQLFFDTTPNEIRLQSGAGMAFVGDGVNLTSGKLQYLVITQDGTTAYMYIDGELQTSDNAIISAGAASDLVTIGNIWGGAAYGTNAWNGAIYEARVQNKFLLANDVWEQYHNSWELYATEIPIFYSIPITDGDIAVTPTAATAIANTVAPTTILGSLLITPNTANVIAAIIDPVVLLSSLSLTPTLAGAITETIAPTVELGAMTVTPTTSSTIADTTDPVVELSSLIITPGVAGAIVDVVDPTAISGNLSLTPDFASSIVSVVDPAVGLGSISTIPVFASSIVDVVDPTVLAGGAIVTPVVATTIADVVNPTVILGSVAVTPVFASAIAGVVNPIVIGGIGLGLESKLDISTGINV